jgi:hypothetical protein
MKSSSDLFEFINYSRIALCYEGAEKGVIKKEKSSSSH